MEVSHNKYSLRCTIVLEQELCEREKNEAGTINQKETTDLMYTT